MRVGYLVAGVYIAVIGASVVLRSRRIAHRLESYEWYSRTYTDALGGGSNPYLIAGAGTGLVIVGLALIVLWVAG